MLSRRAAAAAVELRAMASGFDRLADDAAGALAVVDGCLADLDVAWQGSAVDEFEVRSGDAVATLAPWPSALDSAAATLRSWAGDADRVGWDARVAESQLSAASRSADDVRDELTRAALDRIEQVTLDWSTACRVRSDELSPSIDVLVPVAQLQSLADLQHDRSIGLALGFDALGMELNSVTDPSGLVQDAVTAQLEEFAASPIASLVMTILETARERDLFAADGNLSGEDLALIDRAWASEAVDVWQQATGTQLDGDVAEVVADLVPLLAGLMRVDGSRDWADDDGSWTVEERLHAVLSDAAVAAFTRAPRLVTDRPDTDDPIDAFVLAGAGDIDHLPDHPTASELSYHLHGPPSIGEGFDNTWVFRMLLFDWEQVWGDDRSWAGGAIEIAGVLPVGKLGKVAKVAKVADWTDEALDVERILGPGGLWAHDLAGGHAIEKHVSRDLAFLQNRIDTEGRKVVSSFFDIEEAERVVASAIATDGPAVQQWLQSSTKSYIVEMDLLRPAGITLHADGTVEHGTRVSVKLVRDGTMDAGFRVQTAFVDSRLR